MAVTWKKILTTMDFGADVNMTGLASGDYLKYNGTNWINVTMNNIVMSNGVEVSGDLLQYDGAQWDAHSFTELGIVEDGDITNMVTVGGTLTDGNVVFGDGTKRVSDSGVDGASLTLTGDISDMVETTGTLTSNEVVLGDGTNNVSSSGIDSASLVLTGDISDFITSASIGNMVEAAGTLTNDYLVMGDGSKDVVVDNLQWDGAKDELSGLDILTLSSASILGASSSGMIRFLNDTVTPEELWIALDDNDVPEG